MPHDPRERQAKSPIRGIISQLNQHQASQEKTRETLVSEDGTKRIKVLKKRRVVLSDKDKRRGLYLRYIVGCGIGFVLLLLLLLYYLVQWVHVTGENYLNEQAEELRVSLHAQSVEWEGARIQGFQLAAEKLRLRFPADALIESVEFSGMKGGFSAASVMSGCLHFNELQVAELSLILKEGLETMPAVDIDMGGIVEIDRMTCDSFHARVAGDLSPFAINDAQAYLYYPEGGEARVLFSLSRGKWDFEGWTSFNIKEARLILGPEGGELHAQLEQCTEKTLKGLVGGGIVELYQNLRVGSSLFGPYQFVSRDFDLAFLSNSRIKPFLRALTHKSAEATARESRARITFSTEGKAPTVIADLELKDVEWQGFPALNLIQQHVEHAKRDYYKKPIIANARLRVESRPEVIHLSMREGEMMEPHKISITGSIHLDASNTLSGSLDYALPIELTRVEYPDNISDPLFMEQGISACLSTQLKGFAFIPDDDSRDLEAKAQQARQQRPQANKIDEIKLEPLYPNTQAAPR